MELSEGVTVKKYCAYVPCWPFTPAVAQLERFSRLAPFQKPRSIVRSAGARRRSGLSCAAAGRAAATQARARHFRALMAVNLLSLVSGKTVFPATHPDPIRLPPMDVQID